MNEEQLRFNPDLSDFKAIVVDISWDDCLTQTESFFWK